MVKMYSTVKGIFRNGIIEIIEPIQASDGEEVLITFLEHEQPERRGSLKGIWGQSKIDDELLQQAKRSVFSYEK